MPATWVAMARAIRLYHLRRVTLDVCRRLEDAAPESALVVLQDMLDQKEVDGPCGQ